MTPETNAPLAVYLSSEDAKNITGQIFSSRLNELFIYNQNRPVKSVPESSTTGHGTNVIQGLAISMEATAIPAIIIVAGILRLLSIRQNKISLASNSKSSQEPL